MDFAITPVEWIFLGLALVATIPLLIFVRWILKELKREQDEQPPSE
jgi:hypothetical protein